MDNKILIHKIYFLNIKIDFFLYFLVLPDLIKISRISTTAYKRIASW
jgi:hypothetical protein